MKRLTNILNESEHTEIWHDYDSESTTKIPTYFQVRPSATMDVVSDVFFQDGKIQKFGVNGLSNEDLLTMIICRIEHLQNSKFACHENNMVLNKLEEALMWMNKRSLRIKSEVTSSNGKEERTTSTKTSNVT